MRKITTIFTFCLLGLSTIAASAAVKSNLKSIRDFSKITMFKEAPEDMEIIWEAPEGTETIYSRECDGFFVEAWEAKHETVYGSIVRTVLTDEGEIYCNNVVSGYYTEAWIKGSINGDIVSIYGPQPIGMDYDYEMEDEITYYLVPMKVVINEQQQGTFIPTEDMRFDFKINADGSITAVDPEMLLGICTYGIQPGTEDTYGYVWGGVGDRDIKLSINDTPLITPPAGLTPEKWVWNDEYDPGFVDVIIDNNDIYIAGMDRAIQSSWVKGSIEGKKVTIPSGQFMGADFGNMYYNYFCGATIQYEYDDELEYEYPVARIADAAEFSYDAGKKMLEMENGYIISASPDHERVQDYYTELTIKFENRNPDAVPETPYDLVYDSDDLGDRVWVQIPNTDVDGNLLDTNNLFYQILIDGEPYVFDPDIYMDFYEATDLIPYKMEGYDIYVWGPDHTVYLYTDIKKTVGVRSVYINENGDTLYSEAVIEDVDAVESIEAKDIKTVEYTDLAGRRIAEPAQGIAIRTVIYVDGSRRTSKVVIRK